MLTRSQWTFFRSWTGVVTITIASPQVDWSQNYSILSELILLMSLCAYRIRLPRCGFLLCLVFLLFPFASCHQICLEELVELCCLECLVFTFRRAIHSSFSALAYSSKGMALATRSVSKATCNVVDFVCPTMLWPLLFRSYNILHKHEQPLIMCITMCSCQRLNMRFHSTRLLNSLKLFVLLLPVLILSAQWCGMRMA